MKEHQDHKPSDLERVGQALEGLSHKLEVVESVLHSLKKELSSSVSKLDSMSQPQPANQTSAKPSVVSGDLLRTLQDLSSGATQEQILDTLLEQTGGYLDRAVIFVEKGNELVPWRSSGLLNSDLQSIARDNDSNPIARAAAGHRMVYLEGGLKDAFPWFLYSEQTPSAAVCVPIVFEDTAPIVLYGDSEGDLDLDSLEVIVQWTGLVLKNNYLGVLVSRDREPRKEGHDLFQVEPEILAGAMIDEELEDVAEAVVADEEEDDDFLSHMSAAEAAEALESTDSGFELESEEEASAEPVEAAVQQDSKPPADRQEELAGEFASEAEERLHNEAHRFARLLVSEIKLYNEKIVEAGREQGDLYERLNQDIERSREMYEKRAHPTVLEKRDYFHEELVRILAKGNEALLGDYRHHGTQPPAG